MEIKELAPKSKEIIINAKGQPGVFYDAFSYTIQSQKKNENGDGNGKNHLFIVSQVSSGDSSLDYVPNLIATFIKREIEYQSFENSLKKTNELVEGLIKNNADIKLDLGVALINKEKISVSKIGKVKLLAYRPLNKESFDVFENVTQFNKSHINNKKVFSNIISGEIKKNDRFFFFSPNTKLNLKQKQIISALSDSEQEEFTKTIHKTVAPQDNQNKNPIPCCGIHFEMKEETKKILHQAPKETPGLDSPETKITATEVAKINKGDTLKKTADKLKEMVMGEDSNNSNNWRLVKPRGMNNYFIVGIIALVVIAGLFLFTRGNSKLKEEITSINEKIKVSESRLLLKQDYEARKFLSEAFKELEFIEDNEQKAEILAAAINLQNKIEKVNTGSIPAVLFDLTAYQNIDLDKLNTVLYGNGNIFIGAPEKNYAIKENGPEPVKGTGNIVLSWIKDNTLINYGTGIKIVDLEQNKTTELQKKFNFEPIELKNYEDNLYFLGSKNIYKITNALLKPISELEWLKPGEAEKIPGNFVAFDLDSNIYVLTSERKLAILFKGGLEKLIDLNFDVGLNTELTSLENSEFLVINKASQLARVIDSSGNLKTSYDLSEVDVVKDVFFDKENRILYILSPTKIWSLKL